MGVIGDLVSFVSLATVVGGVGYLVYDYRTNDCNSIIGSFQLRCAANTVTNIGTGFAHAGLELGRGAGHEVANAGRAFAGLFK